MKKIYYLFLAILMISACTTLPTSSEYVTRGDGYFKDKNYPKAIASYTKAISMNNKNLEAYASRGSAHFVVGNYALAEADFKHVLDVNPYQADAYTAYGSVLAAMGDYQNALTVFELAIQLNPSKPENFFSRAGVFFMLGKYKEAITDYTSVINLYPAAEVFNARGATYIKMGDKIKAEQDFSTAKTARIPANLNVYSMLK